MREQKIQGNLEKENLRNLITAAWSNDDSRQWRSANHAWHSKSIFGCSGLIWYARSFKNSRLSQISFRFVSAVSFRRLVILKGSNRREIDYFSHWNRLNSFNWISQVLKGVFRMELAKKCPFLARVPASFVRKARGPVLVSYAERCPVMSEVLHKESETPMKNEGKLYHSFFNAFFPSWSKCSLLSCYERDVKDLDQ